MTKYSVIIPCHNEAETIGAVLAGVKECVPDAEMIVVDDGSVDQTGRIVAEIPWVRLIRLENNSGKGVALRKGMQAAGGDVFVFIDGDGQDDPADLTLVLKEAEKGHAFVNGSKFIGTIEKGGISLPNYWGNRLMSGLINLLFGSAVTDSQSGFRAVSKQLAGPWRLSSIQYEIETEMLCKALKAKVKVKEIPVTRKPRKAGATGFRRLRNGLRILFTILKERFTT